MQRKVAVRSDLVVVYSFITIDNHFFPIFSIDWQLFCMDSEWCSIYSSSNVSTKNCKRPGRNRLWPKLSYYRENFGGGNKEKRETSVRTFGVWTKIMSWIQLQTEYTETACLVHDAYELYKPKTMCIWTNVSTVWKIVLYEKKYCMKNSTVWKIVLYEK